jgi:hypothetical protein
MKPSACSRSYWADELKNSSEQEALVAPTAPFGLYSYKTKSSYRWENLRSGTNCRLSQERGSRHSIVPIAFSRLSDFESLSLQRSSRLELKCDWAEKSLSDCAKQGVALRAEFVIESPRATGDRDRVVGARIDHPPQDSRWSPAFG